MAEGFKKNDILEGANEGNPSTIASIFISAELEKPPLNQSIRTDLMNASSKMDDKSWRRQTSNIINFLFESKIKAVQSIQKSIECFRQWAYQQTSGNTALRQETDNYINGLYEWMKQGKEKGRLDVIETGRLITQRASLIDKLSQTTCDNGGKVNSKLPKRGHNVLDREVREYLKTANWRLGISATQIAQAINTMDRGKYANTSRQAIERRPAFIEHKRLEKTEKLKQHKQKKRR